MRFHFIGIGGIGISALAKYFLEKGHYVSGSDLVLSEPAEDLEKSGAIIYKGKHKTSNIKLPLDKVIFSPAITAENPELIKAKSLGIKTQSYPQALGELTKEHFTIAISGTHGKSTTTAMIGLILEKAKLDPTVVVGTRLKEFGNSNCRVGKSRYLVIEADEHFASFLNYRPQVIVLTNIDLDHLDFYKNINNILKTYTRYIMLLPKNGFLVVNKGDKNSIKIVKNIKPRIFKVKEYDLLQPEAKKIKEILKIPGEHNVLNALAALSVARIINIPDNIVFKTLSEYKGAWRRFEICKTLHHGNVIVVSDYAHHPAEISATLKAAKEKYPNKKIWCVFQPHQYQRTYYLFGGFVDTFRKFPIDKLIITDIYDVAGREEKTIRSKVSAELLVKAIDREFALYLPNDKIIRYVKKNISPKSVLIIMGAGDIYQLVKKF